MRNSTAALPFPSPADQAEDTAGAVRALLVLQGASRTVRPLTYSDALSDPRYRRWAASALAARIAGLDEAADAVGARQVRGVLLEAWIAPEDLPPGSAQDVPASPVGQPAFRGWILDRGTRIEIPDRGPEGRRQSSTLAPALLALATRLAILKGWTHAAPLPGSGLDPARANTAEAMARDVTRLLAWHGIETHGVSGPRPSRGPEAFAATWWHKPHWLRAEVDDDERRTRLADLVNAKTSAGSDDAATHARRTQPAAGLDLLRRAQGPEEAVGDDAPRLLL